MLKQKAHRNNSYIDKNLRNKLKNGHDLSADTTQKQGIQDIMLLNLKASEALLFQYFVPIPALVESHAFVWFATHFRDLARIMAERSGVVNLHLAVQFPAEAGFEC